MFFYKKSLRRGVRPRVLRSRRGPAGLRGDGARLLQPRQEVRRRQEACIQRSEPTPPRTQHHARLGHERRAVRAPARAAGATRAARAASTSQAARRRRRRAGSAGGAHHV